MRKYRLVAKKGEGTFSEVLKAQNVKDGRYHAIKCMKNRFDSIDQVNNLREIQALRRLSPHEHIISLEEVLYDQPTGRLALVFELMDANLYELIRGRRHYLNPNLIKSYMWQLMKSLDHMHRKGIFHRDIKPENILIESTSEIGKGLKLADFGSCRGIYSKQPYTEYISTRWYRAPECLLTDGYYGPEMDLWGAGCVMFEITSLYPLFPGSNEVDQVNRIHKVLGTPTPELITKFKSKGASHINFDFPPQKGIGIPQLIPHASPDSVDLIVKLLKYDASERITAREAMRHPYFKDIREAEAKAQSEKTAANASTSNGNNTTTATVAQASATTNVVVNQVNNSTANTSSIAAAGTAPIAQQQYYNTSNTNKNLPSINPTGNISNDISHQLTAATNKGYSLGAQGGTKTTLAPLTNTNLANNTNNPTNSYNTSSSTAAASSLPPIVSTGANGGANYGNKFNLASSNNANNALMMAGNGNISMLASSNNSVNNSTTGSNANNSQKRKKRYRVNQQRAAQNSENVMKAYGIPKYSTGGAGAPMMTAEGSGLLAGGGSNMSNNNGNLKVMGGINSGANYASAQNRAAYGNGGKKY